jgi:glycerol kinase
VRNSSEYFDDTDPSLLQGAKIPICGIAGDQQAALFGQLALEPGMAKSTYGTGCFMLMNTGNSPVPSESGLITTIAWKIGSETTYALEGSIFIAGAAINWLKDNLQIIHRPEETDKIASDLPDSSGIYVVPAFSGLGAPYWDMNARGAIMGLTQRTTRDHLIRATLESIAYQTRDILEAMKNDSGIDLKMLKVDGGVAKNNFLMQFLSDILHSPVHRPENVETTASGAAYLAGLAINLWTESDIRQFRMKERVFEAGMDKLKRDSLYSGWKKAVGKCINWTSE